MNAITGYILAAALLVIGLLGWQSHTRGVALDKANVTIAAQAEKIATLAGNSETEAKAKAQADTVIADLNQRLSAEVGKTQHVEQLAAQANKRADANAKAATRARDELTKQRDELYAQDQTSNDWRNARIPPAIARGLRIEWDQARSIGLQDDNGASDSGSPGSTVRANPNQPDNDPITASLANAYRWDAAIGQRSYTQGQMLHATSDCLFVVKQSAQQLREIRRLSDEAVGFTKLGGSGNGD